VDIQLIVAAATDSDGYLNKDGTGLLIELLERLKPGKWEDAFIPLKKLGIDSSVEVVLVGSEAVYLTWRDDKYYGKGWHTPGSFIRPGETWQMAAQRCATEELGPNVRIRVADVLTPFNHYNDPRFHHVSHLLHCVITSGEPQGGRWFDACPEDILPVHKQYWPAIAKALRQT
jgi:colanic acid biosynthesis protein WcaH